MTPLAIALLTYISSYLRSRHDLGLEILTLRQQVAVFKRKNPKPHLKRRDRLFWVTSCSIWDRWTGALILVKPETVVRWHRAGFWLYWRFRSRVSRLGRPKIDAEISEAIKRLALENPTWGAPKIQGGLLKLGFKVAERTVSRLSRSADSPLW
jgi:putative transposase